MAYTERYCSVAGGGAHDGTSEANAWTLTEAVAAEAAGQRINVIVGTYANTTTSRTFAAAGTTTAPIWWRGYKTTIGDQDLNNVAVAGTDIPDITFTTGQFAISGAHHIFSNLNINGACTSAGGQCNSTGVNTLLYRIRVTNTAANASSRAAVLGATPQAAIGCYFKATTTAATCVSANNVSYIEGCYVEGGIIGILIAATSMVSHTILNAQAGDAISVNSTITSFIENCSIYEPLGNGIVYNTSITGLSVACNNYFENVNQASKSAINNTSGTNTNFIRCVGNAYYNCTATITGITETFSIFDNGTLASAGFVAPGSQNFALNSVAKAIGFPGLFENTAVYRGYLDVGAVQRIEPASGTVVGRPFPGYTPG